MTGESDLTDAAKAEIAEAVKIVRDDKLHSMVRDIHSRSSTPTPSNTDPPTPAADPSKPQDPNNPPVIPPPPSDPPPDPPKKHGAFWGDRLDN